MTGNSSAVIKSKQGVRSEVVSLFSGRGKWHSLFIILTACVKEKLMWPRGPCTSSLMAGERTGCGKDGHLCDDLGKSISNMELGLG